MAKKSANPADAYRKALKAKELKKNKEARKAARETQTVKRDTREIETEISRLKSQGKLNDEAKKKLESLQSELTYVNKTKEAYVKAHPEAADRVYKQHRQDRDGAEADEAGPSDPNAHLYGEDGKLRDPKRSIYYDPVYNPFGVPPPGMPYKERTPEESDNESDDEIVMPEGPPPDSDADSDDSDDIPLPPGPPPSASQAPPLPPSLPPNVPTGPAASFRPPIHVQSSAAWGWGDELAYTPQPGPAASSSRPYRPPTHASLPARPPPTVQDPLSDVPTQTYQGRRMEHALPAKPDASGSTAAAAQPSQTSNAAASAKHVDYSAAAITAAPVMRDLRKEATAFVPRGVKRKQAQAPGGVNVNAAPGRGQVDEDGDERRVVQEEEGGGLLGKLRGVIGDSSQAEKKAKKAGEGDDEYQKFLEGLGDLQ